MCPENARVFVIEDTDVYQDSIADLLGAAGHTVALTARNFDEVLKIFSGTTLTDLRINVATIDGNLSSLGGEGNIIANALKNRFPEIKRVGLSAGRPLQEIDAHLHKFDIEQLGGVVTKL